MFDKSQAGSFIGQTLFDSDGSKIGKIGQVYLDEVHDQPEWVTVNTGLFGTSESFVPLAEATLTDGGLAVPYSKDAIKDAPNIEDSGQLSEAQEQDLYEHYNVPYTTEGSTFADTSKLSQTTPNTQTGQTGVSDVSGSGDAYGDSRHVADQRGTGLTDDAMTRSEERLNVGTERVQTGKARLRKWVETETQQVEVPVRKEKAVLVSEPITGDNAGEAFEGAQISEDEHVVTLNEERPVVDVEAVPVERVRLDTQVQESTQTVNKDVRKERVELQDDTTGEPATDQN